MYISVFILLCTLLLLNEASSKHDEIRCGSKTCEKKEMCALQKTFCTQPPCGPMAVCIPKCKKHEHYFECGACDTICGEDQADCADDCEVGTGSCGCKKGFCRDQKTHKCVPDQ